MKDMEEKKEMVNSPSHYNQGNIEAIDAMVSAFGKEAVADFCKCNVFKYTFRSGVKQPKESILKAEWYLKKYMELAPEFCEEWRQHSSGLYEVSSLGNIRRVGNDTNRKKVTLKNGYDTIVLSINGDTSIHYVHKLVAECFIPNPNNYNEINHINHIRTDNRVENLEWCSRKNNVQDALGVSLYVYNVFGEFIDKFNSIRECEGFLNYGRSSLDIYIDSEKPRGNLVFYTRELSEEDIKNASWYLDKYIELKTKPLPPIECCDNGDVVMEEQEYPHRETLAEALERKEAEFYTALTKQGLSRRQIDNLLGKCD